MIEHKVGDTVRRVNGNNGNIHEGDYMKVTKIEGCATWGFITSGLNEGEEGQGDSVNFVLVAITKKMSSISEKIKLLTKGEPEKSNIKAGLRTVNDEFTEEGKGAFLEYLYQESKDDFKTKIADPINKDKEDSK